MSTVHKTSEWIDFTYWVTASVLATVKGVVNEVEAVAGPRFGGSAAIELNMFLLLNGPM